MSEASAGIDELVAGAATLEKWPLGRLIRLFEDARPEGIVARRAALECLDERSMSPRAAILGLTGTPGAGKSTLLGEIATRLIQRDPQRSVAVIAVDPSSHRSGGSILGDRTRVNFPVGERRLFFRSQASDQELGGLGRATYPVVRLLERLFDVVFVETVGIGQSEREVERIADRVYLVLQPMGGDHVQFMKAGIMEVPDVFILNKADLGAAARRSYHSLRASIDFVRPGETQPPRILRTSTVTGEGIDELVGDIETRVTGSHPMQNGHRRERYFFEKWVREEYGRAGLSVLSRQHGTDGLLAHNGGFEGAQTAFIGAMSGDTT